MSRPERCWSDLRRRVLCALAVMVAVSLPTFTSGEGVAITFDDLPLNGTLPAGTTRTELVRRVLSVLKQHHVPPVYGFVNAKKLEGDADAAQALKIWVAGGERVGNHTYAHPDLNQQTSELFLSNVYQNEPVLELLSPDADWRWFRYPFLREGDELEKRRRVRAALREHGYRIAQVTIDYEDYLWNSPYARCVAKPDPNAVRWLRSTYVATAAAYIDADRQMAHLIVGRDITHVLLLHLGAFSDNILPDLLALLHQKGLQLVTLEQAQQDPVYQSDPDAGSRYGGTLLEQWLDLRKIKYPPAPSKPYKELAALCQ